jgi:hypothetical protein
MQLRVETTTTDDATKPTISAQFMLLPLSFYANAKIDDECS